MLTFAPSNAVVNAWPTLGAAIVAVVGTLTGVLITQWGQRRQGRESDVRRTEEWGRDRRLAAYASFVRAVSKRISALDHLRTRSGHAKSLGPSSEAARHAAVQEAENAEAEMWAALREVRLVGPDEVAEKGERVARHYSAGSVDSEGFPPTGGSSLESQFADAARRAVGVPASDLPPPNPSDR